MRETPRKGRPAALVSSPFPAKPREGGSGVAAQGDVPNSGGAEPIPGVEWAAHAQRHGRYVHKFVRGHLFSGFAVDLDAFDGLGVASLVRPFCLAGGCRTGYRKE